MRRSYALGLGVALFACAAVPAAAQSPWRLRSPDGTSWVQFGLLAQPQGEWITTADGEGTSQNLFLRRLRLIAGGRVTSRISFFIETDSPNLGKGAASGRKDESFFLQDAIFTFALRDQLQIDAGMLLLPLSHNAGQGATTLLAVDYSPWTFLHSDPTSSRVGRDYGVQARGYLFSKHLEYRAGAFQGARGGDATAPFRFLVRGVWYPFDAETGFFYTGTNLGTRRILAIGASVDHQDDYTSVGADVYWDWKLRRGDGVSAQANVVRYDGGATFPQLPRQSAWLVEAGYYVAGPAIGPFVQVAGRDPAGGAPGGERKIVGGVAWWGSGHRFNVKAGLGRVTRDGGPGRTQFVLQGQVYVY